MRNLHLLHSAVVPDIVELKDCHSLCIDCDDSGIIYCAVKDSVLSFDSSNKKVNSSLSLSDEGFLSPGSEIVSLQHLPENMSVCIATSCGNIVSWSTETAQAECVGSISDGIAAMSWSPDLELITLVSGSGTLVLMTKEFDSLVETSLHVEGFGEAKPITVGWGKKETQFHGSEGKAAAKRAVEVVKSDLSMDDHKPRISWRADGQFFAVSAISPTTGGRQIRVWSREGELFSTSENTLDLGHSLSYKPSGSLIATSAKKIGKLWVALLEKNGLQHGEFELPFSVDDVQVVEVLWNIESTVLAVWCRRVSSVENSKLESYIQLWTVNNYHWYLKQNLEFIEDSVKSVIWDPAHAYCLHVVCDTGLYLQYTWTWGIDTSLGTAAEDLVSVGVVDGNKLLVSPFRHMTIPPPMAAYQLHHSTTVACATFGSGSFSNNIITLLTDGSLCVFKLKHETDAEVANAAVGCSVKILAAGGNGFKIKCSLPKLSSQLRFSDGREIQDKAAIDLLKVPLNIQHLLWIEEDTILFTSQISSVNADSASWGLVKAKLDFVLQTYFIKSITKLNSSALALIRNQETGTIAVELLDGQVLKFDAEAELTLPWLGQNGLQLHFPNPCPHVAVTQIGGQEVVIGLTDRHRLYVNNIEISNNCTSFAIHKEFLLLTTHSHTLRCIRRQTPLEVLPTLSTSKAHVFDESIRAVERGSRIVCVVPDGTKVVLQMPRGNLETIHPRALVIYAVQQLLNGLKYDEAFTLMKSQRIDMNLLYDHDPVSFLANCKTLITQLDSPTKINLFLSSLQEGDVTKTMYTATYVRSAEAADKQKSSSKIKNKLDTVCDAVRESLQLIDRDRYILSIITTYVKKKMPELENALHCIRAAKEKSSGEVSASEALVYLLYHIDVNELYNVALGTYDFDLVLMVAEKSTKDPKEYLADLNNLKSMEQNYQRYTIDLRLRKYTSALEHISGCGKEKFEECMKLIKEQKLYAKALTLFKQGSSEYKEVAAAYGQHLLEHKLYEEAGLVFVKSGNDESALSAYEQALDWRQALCAASRLKINASEVSDLCHRLALRLKDENRHIEASCLLEQYCEHYEDAIVLLISGHQWNEALRLIHKYNRSDLLETNLRPCVVEACDKLITLIDGKQSEFIRLRDRLDVVRKKKAADLELYDTLGGRDAYRSGDSDIYSDTSSISGAESTRSSAYSRSTGHSSKSRKKQKNKKWSLREGSVHEDLALVEALYKTVSQVDSWRDDVGATLRALVQFSYEDEACKLQKSYDEVIRIFESSLPLIWTEELRDTSKSHSHNQLSLGPESTANSITEAFRQRDKQNLESGAKSTEPRLDDVMLFSPALNKSIRWRLSMLSDRST